MGLKTLNLRLSEATLDTGAARPFSALGIWGYRARFSGFRVLGVFRISLLGI